MLKGLAYGNFWNFFLCSSFLSGILRCNFSWFSIHEISLCFSSKQDSMLCSLLLTHWFVQTEFWGNCQITSLISSLSSDREYLLPVVTKRCLIHFVFFFCFNRKLNSVPPFKISYLLKNYIILKYSWLANVMLVLSV